ncbi:hypothetical protein BDZ89DRAFT_1137683 [Hymenopellis radicata]|nr:hypothetical protein BDZ89DRAFT_1137683 [Hymenopellis radicata]
MAPPPSTRNEESIGDTDSDVSSVDIDFNAKPREHANLRRSLTGRHTALLAISSGIGTGLFLGSGSALSNAGPLGLLLGYALMGVITSGIAFISAETAAFLPVSGGFIRHIPMFTDRALGITVGWMFWYLLAIFAAADVVAASSLIGYWRPDLNPAIFISVFGFLMVVFNFLPVPFYGELQFFFGILKSLLIIALILAGIIVDVGGSPTGEYIGGRNWHPTPIKEYLVSGSTGRFLAIWSTLINAAFAMGNIQITTSIGSEVINPRVNLPKAMRRVFWRIFFFYIVSLIVVGLLISADDPRLGTGSNTASSPFVLAFKTAGIKVFPSIINAVVITSAFSSGNGVIFLASRTLVGLASDGSAPRFMLKTNRVGAPYWAVASSCIFLPLAYLNCGGETPITVFNWFTSLIAVAGLNVWVVICLAYVRFYLGMKKRGFNRDDLFYKSWGQPGVASACVWDYVLPHSVLFRIRSLLPGNWSVSAFLSNYINCFIFLALYVALKFTIKSPWISYEDMDFSQMEAIKAEKKAQELDTDSSKVPWWRRIIEKLFDA